MPDIWIGRSEEDKKRFSDKGLIFIGKQWVRMGQLVNLSNPVYLDIARSHVIMVCGKRGSGKCLLGDTLIQLANGKIVPIKEIEKEKGKILALNEKLKIEKTNKQGFFKRKVNKILKIKLRSGKEIKLTPDHPLLTVKGWVPAKNLKKRDRIATPRKVNAFGNKNLDDWKIKLLAYLIAEGHTKKVVLFVNSDKKIINEFKNCIKKLDAKLEVKEDKKGHFRVIDKEFKNIVIKTNLKRNARGRFVKGTKILIKKRSIREFIEKYGLFNKLAPEKEIPQEILQLKKKKLALFLNRLFSCDGSIYKMSKKKGEIWQISYSSSSKKLILQVQNLLLRFGIVAKLREKRIKRGERKHINYELIINPQFIEQFFKEIGFFGEKEKKLKKAVKEIKNKKRNPNVDTIPKEIWEIYKPKSYSFLGKRFGYKIPKGFRTKINYLPSRKTLLRIAEIEKNKFLKKLATSDIFWDEIEEITLIRGKFEVYDFSVPNHHNFIANDIIVHNSYSLGVIAESITDMPEEVKENIAPLIFDTMGIYWSMAYRNDKEIDLLRQWQLKPKNLPVRVFVPYAYYDEFLKRGIGKIESFALAVHDVSYEDWLITFGLSYKDPIGIAIQKAVLKLQEQFKETSKAYDIDDIIETIKVDAETSKEHKLAAINLFNAAKAWGIFASKQEKTTTTRELLKAGTTTVLDLSMYSSVGVFNVRALVIGLLCRKIFNERMLARKLEEIQAVRHGLEYLHFKEKRELPLAWIFIDEMHEFLPKQGKTPATDALIQLLREGRQPGISLVFATQQPGKLHSDAITQSDIIISHRLTAKPDLDALSEIMQSYLAQDIFAYMNNLPKYKGSAIILDDNSERIYAIRIRPRFTWHGGEAPTAVKVLKRE